MLQMVRNGDINYHSVLQSSARLSPGVPIQGQDPLRQMKTSIVVFTTLVSRAAMEGGLSPGDRLSAGGLLYPVGGGLPGFRGALRSRHAMYHDFIYRVHHLRVNPNYSHAIQKCCDYIELSLDRKIRTADLAALVGYTEYYLTEKFKKETGQSVSSYIRYVKVERAKVLLESTDLSVREIAERWPSTPSTISSRASATPPATPRAVPEEIQSTIGAPRISGHRLICPISFFLTWTLSRPQGNTIQTRKLINGGTTNDYRDRL